MRAVAATSFLVLAACADVVGIEEVLPPGGGKTCFAALSYGSPAPLNPTAERSSGGETINYNSQLNAEPMPDGLALNLVEGAGVYASRSIGPVSNVALTGDESQLATCGTCVVLVADADAVSESFKAIYMPTAGSITITSVSPRLRGTLSDVTFVEIEFGSGGAQETVPNGCSSHIASFAFDTAVTQTAR